MDGISNEIISKSVETMNQVMKSAQNKNLEIAEKMVSMNLEIALGVENGKGELLDVVA